MSEHQCLWSEKRKVFINVNAQTANALSCKWDVKSMVALKCKSQHTTTNHRTQQQLTNQLYKGKHNKSQNTTVNKKNCHNKLHWGFLICNCDWHFRANRTNHQRGLWNNPVLCVLLLLMMLMNGATVLEMVTIPVSYAHTWSGHDGSHHAASRTLTCGGWAAAPAELQPPNLSKFFFSPMRHKKYESKLIRVIFSYHLSVFSSRLCLHSWDSLRSVILSQTPARRMLTECMCRRAAQGKRSELHTSGELKVQRSSCPDDG